MLKSPVLSHLFIVLAAVLFFFIQGPELVFNLSDHLFDDGDSIVNAWILAWNAHALSHSGVAVWDAPIFFPAKNVLAFSETMFGNLWLTLPIQYLTDNYVLASNALVAVSFVLGTYCVFILVKDLTGNYWASLFAGLVFSFNPYRWGHIPHLQLLPFFWAPLALFFANRFVETSKSRYFHGMLITTWIQYYASVYLGTMLLTLLITLFLIHILLECKGKERWIYFSEPPLRRMFLIGLGSSLLVLLPLAIPYLNTALKWNFFRTIGENMVYSVEPGSFIFPSFAYSNYQWLRELLIDHIHHDKRETAVFVGAIPLLFALSTALFRKSLKNHFTQYQNKIIFRYGLISIVMALIMMGPYLSVFGENTGIPMPYQLVFRFVPGGSAMRVPARFVLPFLLSLSVLCGFGLAFMLSLIKNRSASIKSILLFFAGALLLLDYKIIPWKGVYVEPGGKFPAVYNYLNQTNPGKPILELPVDRWIKFKYLHYQTLHWRPALGGFSSWSTPAFDSMKRYTRGCPGDECYRFLQIAPAKTLVVHLQEYSNVLRKIWQSADLTQYGFYPPKRFGDAIVWERNGENTISRRSKLKISKVYFASDPHGLISIIFFEPAGENKSWALLTGNKFEVGFSMRNLNGEEFKVVKNSMAPPYILSGESFNKAFTQLGKVAPGSLELMKIKSPLFESLSIDRSSMIFLDDKNTSRGGVNGLNAQINISSGFLSEKSYYVDAFEYFKVEALNTGKNFWLDPSTNKLLHDSTFGNVFLGIQWFKKSAVSSCTHQKSRPVKEAQVAIPHIIAPGEKITLEKYIKSPSDAGDYVLLVNMGSNDAGWFDQANEPSIRCFDISVGPITASLFEGDLSRFYKNPQTADAKRALEAFKGLPRLEQERIILDGARDIRKNGGPASLFFQKGDRHLRYKTLELADAIKKKRAEVASPLP